MDSIIRENQQLLTKLNSLTVANEKLTSERKFLYELEAKTKEELQKTQEEYLEFKLEKDIISLTEDKVTLTDKLESLQSVHKRDLDFNKELIVSKRKLEDSISEIKRIKTAPVSPALEVRVAVLQSDNLNQELSLLQSECNKQSKEIRSLQDVIFKLNTKVEFYKTVQDNIHKLKEEKIGLEKRNEMIPNLSKQLAEKTVKCELLEKEKMHWQSFLEQNKIEPEIQSPYDMIKLLSQKNNQIAELKDLVGQARANEVKSQLLIQDCTEKSDKLRDAFEKLEQTISKLEKEKLSLIRKANLADKQCYLLKEQIKSYEYEELTFNKAPIDSNKARIESLEKHILELLSLNEHLESHILSLERGSSKTDKKDLHESERLAKAEFERKETDELSLAAQLLINEKLSEEMKQGFMHQVSEYSRSVQTILGYHLEILDEHRTKLLSIYGKEPLIYYHSGEKRGQLESNSNTELLRHWIDRGSLPCFMASLTLELFSNLTH